MLSVNHGNFLHLVRSNTPGVWVLLSILLTTVKTTPDYHSISYILFSFKFSLLLPPLLLAILLLAFYFFFSYLSIPYLSHKSPKGTKYSRCCLILLTAFREGPLTLYIAMFNSLAIQPRQPTNLMVTPDILITGGCLWAYAFS